jgi:signal transduction histidine kinase
MFEMLNQWLFDSSGLTSHGFCLLWEPWLIWIYAVSDSLIGLSYFSIPLALAVIARQRRDLVLRPFLWLFAAFILLCGTTHWLDILTLWVPAYGLEGLVKAVTAVASVVTAIALWKLLPKALTLPSPAQYREANIALLASQEKLIQSQKMETIGQLTGGIAHDFNNILQAITSSLTFVEKRIAEGRTQEVERYLTAMRQASGSAAALTNRLLAFSRRQALQPKEVELDALISGMEELIRRTLGPAIQLDLFLGDGKLNAICDQNQLESALLNLAINARDAMPAGGVLTIEIYDHALTAENLKGGDGVKPGRYAEIRVSDTGHGMTPDVLTHVFEPFFTTKPIGAGTGLGLSQVYGFVKQSGGMVRLESQPDTGTVVHFYLPAHERSPEITEANPSLSRKTNVFTPQHAQGKVLIVEDQTDIREQIAELLKDMGCTPIEAADGPSGLSIVQSGEALDLLITDVGLPGLNGRQLADAARTLDPDLPVLFITGYAGEALDSHPLPKGMIVLRKPFSLEAISAQVSGLLEINKFISLSA